MLCWTFGGFPRFFQLKKKHSVKFDAIFSIKKANRDFFNFPCKTFCSLKGDRMQKSFDISHKGTWNTSLTRLIGLAGKKCVWKYIIEFHFLMPKMPFFETLRKSRKKRAIIFKFRIDNKGTLHASTINSSLFAEDVSIAKYNRLASRNDLRSGWAHIMLYSYTA